MEVYKMNAHTFPLLKKKVYTEMAESRVVVFLSRKNPRLDPETHSQKAFPTHGQSEDHPIIKRVWKNSKASHYQDSPT